MFNAPDFNAPNQLSNVARANFESQLAIFTALAGKAFESVEKIVDLNLNAARATLEDSSNAARQLLSAKDPQEFFALTAAQAQPAAAKAAAYGRHLASIAANAQAEFTRTAEEQFADTTRKVTELVDDVAKNAPAGSENMIAIVKSAIGNANASYEQISKTTKQAVEAMESNMNTAVTQLSQATEKAATHASSRARK